MRNLYDRVRDEASRLDPRRAAANVVLSPLYLTAWIVGRLAASVWWVLSRAWATALIGFRDGRGR